MPRAYEQFSFVCALLVGRILICLLRSLSLRHVEDKKGLRQRQKRQQQWGVGSANNYDGMLIE
jgi:hypothetical protein